MFTLKTVRANQKVIAIGVAFVVICVVVFQQITAFAGLADSTRGFAWSGGADTILPGGYTGMGAISMNNVTEPSGTNYGVNIPSVDGAVTGYAWSGATDINGQPGAGYGWISFQSGDLAGCAPALNAAWRFGNSLTGGARILAIRNSMASTNAGGYDGCIDLSGITIVGNKLSGYGWSSDLGWIDFSSVDLAFPAAGPDLAVESLTPSAGPYEENTPITLTGVVKNKGDATTGVGFSDVLYYQWGGTGGAWTAIPTAPASHPALLNDLTVNDTGSYTPNATGQLYFKYCADPAGAVVLESGPAKADNCFISPAFDVAANGSGADLVIDSFTTDGVPYTQGVAITLNGRVKNNGAAVTPREFSDKYTYSWTGDTGPWLDFAGGQIDHAPLAGGGATADDITTFIPNQGGTLHIQYCVDAVPADGKIAEGVTGESNNCRIINPALDVSGSVPGTCPPRTINNCQLPVTSSDGLVQGMCTGTHNGNPYRGTCSRTCDTATGVWGNPGTDECYAGSITANPNSVLPNKYTTLSWSVEPAASCWVDGSNNADHWDNIPSNGTAHNEDTSPLADDIVYSLACGTSDNLLDTVPVDVSGPDLSANPLIVDIGKKSTITWKPKGLVCTVKKGGVDLPGAIGVNVQGSADVTINAQTTFTLICTDPAFPGNPPLTDSVTVNITGWQAGT